MKRIVVGDDLSEASRWLTEAVASLASAFGAKVDVVHVHAAKEVAMLTSGVGMADGIPVQAFVDAREAERETLEEHRRALVERGLVAETHVVEGDPGDVLVETCRQSDADLLVLGKHKRGLVGRALLGSVASKVVKRAPCPVLVIPVDETPGKQSP